MLKDYFKTTRLDLKFDVWTLVIPCWWSFIFAAFASPEPTSFLVRTFLLITLGAVLMLGVGCTYDDIIDRNIDSRTFRTKDRPIASGRLHLPQAWLFLAVQGIICLIILFQMRPATIMVGTIAVLLLAIYPFIKRFLSITGLFLGLCINWGVFVTWVEVRGDLNFTAVLIYLACVCWAVFYNTVYEIQDMEDDRKNNVKSIALVFKKKSNIFVSITAIGMLSFILAAAFTVFSKPYFWVIIPLPWLPMLIDSLKIKIDSPQTAFTIFHRNRDYAFLITSGLAVSALLEYLFR